MLDNLLNTVRQGVEKVQRRGEEMTHVARLRVEVFQLSRDLEGHFARLGRAFHSGADADLLQGIRAEIQRTEGEIRDREQLIAELGDADTEASEGVSGAEIQRDLSSSEVRSAPAAASGQPTSPDLQKQQPADVTPTSSASSAAAPVSNRPAFVEAPEGTTDSGPR